MKRSTDRVLTTHAGSLIRTPAIIEAMIAIDMGRPIDAEAYARDLREGVAEVVRRQAQAGVDVVSDGEYGKSGWNRYVERFTGFSPYEVETKDMAGFWPEQDRFGDFYRQYGAMETTMWIPDEVPSKATYRGTSKAVWFTCTGPVEYEPEPLQRDIANFKAALEGVEVEEAFMPVAAPCSIEVFQNRHYGSQEQYLFALADALAVEYRMIADLGFLVQVDDAILPMQKFMFMQDRSMKEYHAWAEMRVEALNRALEAIPRERVRYHICWGSQNVPHTTDPALRDIMDIILKVKAGAFSIGGRIRATSTNSGCGRR